MRTYLAIALLEVSMTIGRALASGHGPVFGLTTPTNSKGGWSLDIGSMSRVGRENSGSMSRVMLSYGVTEDFQLSFTAPYVFASAPLAPSRGTSMMSATSDFEGIAAWRFHRQGTDIGTRVESTAYASLIVPGLQRPKGMVGNLNRAPGAYMAVATGIASRAHYLWGGVGYTHFAKNQGDQRPQLLTYSVVWGYRPPAFRKDYPHWDWRGFLEMTGEKSGRVRRGEQLMPDTAAHQIFLGPSVLGIYKNYAVEGGIQFPVYRLVGQSFQQDRYRFALNFSYFF